MTVEDILKQTGLSDEQIKALDPKITGAFTQVVSTAQQTLDQAELAKRAQAQQYDEQIAPALDSWGNEKARLDAEVAFYKTQLEGAKAGGFVPATVPTTPPTPARTPDGKFVANSNDVPGSPKIVENLRNEIGGAFATVAEMQWKYRTLYGTEMPDSPVTIIREATAQRMSPADYAAKKYDFAGKESAKRAEEQKKHDDAITAAAIAENDKKWAERVGSNPMVRQAEASSFSVLDKAVKANQRPNPLGMTREDRHRATQQAIQKEIAANESSTVQ